MVNRYNLLSPSGIRHTIWAETIYLAIQEVVIIDNGVYSTATYFDLNGIKKG
jgi:hypothetical protein